MTISLCMIVKNEENVLARCLKSIKGFVDQIIIVDTGSTDKTKEIAKKFTQDVYDYKWNNNFADARNYAKEFASCNYVMWLDADDIVPQKTLNELIKLKPYLSADVYMLKYDIAFNKNKPTFSYFRERIIKNCNNAIWQGAVHECIPPFGKVEQLSLSIWHKKFNAPQLSNRNLNIYENILKTRNLSPRETYYYGRELFDHKKYKKCASVLKKFVNSNQGWQENVIDALYLISICCQKLGNNNKSLEYLFKTFKYDTPRANICCLIGNYFFEQKKFNIAKYWYTQATKCEDISNKGGFVDKLYYNYYPYLQLSCCYYYLGNIQNAILYNKKAEKHFNSPTTKANNEFYKKYLTTKN